jgi:hypothetical protein
MEITTNARIDYQKNPYLERKCPICGRKVKDLGVKGNPCFYCGYGIEEHDRRRRRKEMNFERG